MDVTEMGSHWINPPHPQKQQHKFTKLKANNLYVGLWNEDCVMKYNFALMITMFYTWSGTWLLAKY